MRKGSPSPIGNRPHTRNLRIHSAPEPGHRELSRLAEEDHWALDGMPERLDGTAYGEPLLVREGGEVSVCSARALPCPGTDVPRKSGMWWRYRGRSVMPPPFLIGELARSSPGDDVDRALKHGRLQGRRMENVPGKQATYVRRAEVVAAPFDGKASPGSRLSA